MAPEPTASTTFQLESIDNLATEYRSNQSDRIS